MKSYVGAPASLQAWLLLSSAQKNSHPTLFILPDQDTLESIHSNLMSLRGLVEIKPPLIRLPGWDRMIYAGIQPSLRTRHERSRALAETCYLNQSAPIILTTLEALLLATPARTAFQEDSIKIRTGLDLQNRAEWLRQVEDLGFLRTDPVEDPGSFSVRGGIIDLFPPHLDFPLRIEFFGDAIESIRTFDPETQKTIDSLADQEVTIFPAREFRLTRSNHLQIREKIKLFSDSHEIPRKIRDPIIEAIQHQRYLPQSDLWTPFLSDRTTNFMDYLSPDTEVVWMNRDQCLLELQSTLEFCESNFNHSLNEGNLIPNPLHLFVRKEETLPLLDERSTLSFGLNLDSSFSKTDPPQSINITENFNWLQSGRFSKELFLSRMRECAESGIQVTIFSSSNLHQERIQSYLADLPSSHRSQIKIKPGFITPSFLWPEGKIALVHDSALFGGRKIGSTPHSKKDWKGLQSLSDLSPGDTVVHSVHGIGIYRGLRRLTVMGTAESDFLQLEYANQDKLYLPVYRLESLQKYHSNADSAPLDRLGSAQFEKTKKKVKDNVQKLAFDLVQLYAARSLQTGTRFSPRGSEYIEFESSFPHQETPDQLKVLEEVFQDLESGKLMDRLVCGDVGFGKTEIAMRAAFQAVLSGKQVAVMVPTTLLAQQHEQTFKKRFLPFAMEVDGISRFKVPKIQKEILERVKAGKTDILIGTHRILSRDVEFEDLGLIIVDEEHRFGVEHKEKLKSLRVNTHVLSLSATPIPRTMHMAFSGVRDISVMMTPPMDRLPVRTFVTKYDETAIKTAIETEIRRGGQVFFVHNRVQSIFTVADSLKTLLPDVTFVVGHAQMPERELEKTMSAFISKEAQVLVSTAIIESGIDISSVNTILIDRADQFGLAQLYQLRGRVGRGDQRAFAYLLTPESGQITDESKRRLEVIQRFIDLGSGFNIASHDLEIRGGGNLLGAEQAGHIAAVGFDLYLELLQEAVDEIKGQSISIESKPSDPEIKAPFSSYLDEKYIPDLHQRLAYYRKLSAAQDEQTLLAIEAELRDRYGLPPPEANNLLWIIRLKHLLRNVGVEILTVGDQKLSLKFSSTRAGLDPQKLVLAMTRQPGKIQLTPDQKLVVSLPTASLLDIYLGLERLLESMT